MNNIVYKKLIEVAKEKKVISYSELNESCGIGLDLSLAQDRSKIGDILGEVSAFEVKNKRPMLSALAVLKNSHPPKPAPGFFNYAKELGLVKTGEDETKFFYRQLNECFQEWSK